MLHPYLLSAPGLRLVLQRAAAAPRPALRAQRALRRRARRGRRTDDAEEADADEAEADADGGAPVVGCPPVMEQIFLW